MLAWLQAHDPGYAALRRAARAALIMPAMFALGAKAIGNPALGTFAAFGSFAMLLLVDFSGSIRERVSDQVALGLACAVLIALGTLASRTTWLAAVAMALVAFGILFAGVLSSVLAGATTALLLSFILPVSLRAPASAIPDRVAGWALAAAASVLAISLLWPAPARNPVREATIGAARALAQRLRADVSFFMGPRNADAEETHRVAVARADEAVDRLQKVFFTTPYRPGGLTTEGRTLIRLVDHLRWLDTIVLRFGPVTHSPHVSPGVWEVKTSSADVLDRAADLLEQPRGSSDRLRDAMGRTRAALAQLEQATISLLPVDVGSADEGRSSARAMVSSMDPSFRAQELTFVVGQIATNTEFAAAAAQRSWADRLLGRQPRGVRPIWTEAQRRAGTHLTRESQWLRNSLRGATALGLAVLVADALNVQHGFWVGLGTLAVLRSNALSTGQNTIRALGGTAVGFLIGGLLVYLLGTNTTVLWILLPVAVLLAGLAPSAISFAAGQAGFTLTLLILFNIVAPAGWKIGLVRIEDVALGCAVSVGVGLLFWPRGARGALRDAMARAYTDSVRYLADAVAYGVGCCDPSGPRVQTPGEQALAAAAAAGRLDDTFRGYLAERGPKPAALADVTGLVTGVTGVRLAADSVLNLWSRDGGGSSGERSAARHELTSAAENLTVWYDHFAAGLTGREPVPDPLPPDQVAGGRLIDAVGEDLRGSGGPATATGVRVIWTGDHLDAVRRLQQTLVDRARAATHEREAGSSPAER